jgi:hypothetical protein
LLLFRGASGPAFSPLYIRLSTQESAPEPILCTASYRITLNILVHSKARIRCWIRRQMDKSQKSQKKQAQAKKKAKILTLLIKILA